MPKDIYSTFRSLHKAQSTLIGTFPKARTELLDFHYKDQLDEYLGAIDRFKGRKLLITAESEKDAASLIRRSLLLSDLVLFSVDSFIGHPALALLPISDEMASPVLGASAMLDPSTGRHTFATAVVFMAGTSLRMASAAEAGERVQILGTSWSGTGSKAWERTKFARLADEVADSHGTRCHVAGGLIHVQLPKDESLLADTAPLMAMGRVVYAPFAVGNTAFEPQQELLLKAGMLGSTLASAKAPTSSSASKERVLLQLDMPYLEGLPLSTLAKVIDDEGESIRSFRRQFDRLMEDIANLERDSEQTVRFTKFKRDVLEDELDKVRQALSRVARMNSVIRAGAYVGIAGLSVAAMQGLSLPSLITGLTGTLAAALTAWYRSYLDACEARNLPAHVLWRLERRAS
jgi:hypothetical protein